MTKYKDLILIPLTALTFIPAVMLMERAWGVFAAGDEADRWRAVIVSNINFLFIFNLVMIGLIGGAIGYSQRRRPKVRFAIMGLTWITIFGVGSLLSQTTPIEVPN